MIVEVYVVATQELCKEWNAAREDGKAYAPETQVLIPIISGYADVGHSQPR